MQLRILSAIGKYSSKKPVRLHMPGHKANRKFCKLFKGADLDVTELSSIDNENITALAERDIAEIVGATKAWFLTGGSSLGILSMVYAVRDKGKSLVIERSSHKSVYNALELFDVKPIIVDSFDGNDEKFTKDIEKALTHDTIGALLTCPNYYGDVFDLKSVSAVLREKRKLLLIDSAHGGHLKFVHDAPYTGDFADVWVDGLHKTFPTMNQGAALYTSNSSLISKLDEAVKKLSTTSPSYPLLSSIEYGVKYMDDNKTELQKVIDIVNGLKQKTEDLGFCVSKSVDPLKLYVNFLSCGIDPKIAGKTLEDNGIFFEMQDKEGVLFMFSVMNTKKDVDKLYRVLKKISKLEKNAEIKNKTLIKPEVKLDYLEARKKDAEWVDMDRAVDRISAVNVGNFPPCSPIVIAGELITKEIIDTIDQNSCFGVKDGKILVVKE